MNPNLSKIGWNDYYQHQLASNKRANSIPVRITREDRGRYTVHTGETTAPAQLSGTFLNSAESPLDHPTVGDWVLVEPIEPGGGFLIYALLERHSLFTRQSAGKTSEDQLLAANIDYLFIMTGLDQDYNPKRIQRYLTQAWNSGAHPVVILNKADLVDDPDKMVKDLELIIPNVPIHAISAVYQKELDSLDAYFIPGKTIALSGSSGVGKSSLINALLGEQRLQTQANRDNDSRGRHTTTWRELVLMESSACIIDLPGMRELQLTGDSSGVAKTFPEIKSLARQCKFRNCQHGDEPGCAVQEALNTGELAWERYSQYIKLRQENALAKKRSKFRKPVKSTKVMRFAEKKAFFKEVTVQYRKNKNAKRKLDQMDGF